MQDIQSSIFVLALDKSTESTSGNTDSDTVHLNEMSHGGGSRVNSCNRWFDKVLQVYDEEIKSVYVLIRFEDVYSRKHHLGSSLHSSQVIDGFCFLIHCQEQLKGDGFILLSRRLTETICLLCFLLR